MSLLDDLRGIDFSAVVQARGSISVAVQDPDLQSILQGGAAQAALAGLGQSMQNLQGTFSSPEAILRPVIDTIGGLNVNLSTKDLPIDRYVSAVGEGTQVVLRIIDGLASDPNNVGAFLGASLGGQIDSMSRFISSYAQVGTPDVGRLRATLDRMDRGLSGSPAEMADLVLDVLLPFPRTALLEIRTNLDGILQVAASIQFPEGRFRGLEAALDAVNAAALAGDAAALERTLHELGQVRDNTLAVVEGDLLGVFEQIGRMRLDAALAPMVQAAGALRVAQVGVLDLLESVRGQLASVRAQIESADPAEVGAFLERMADFLEEQAQALVVAPIDAAVVRLEEFIRGLFRQLPLRSIRAEITRFLHQIAEAIRGLGIEAAVESVRNTLAQIRDTVSAGNLTDEVQQALNQARQTIARVLGGITGALGEISGRINEVAAEAEAVLERAADALVGFAQAVRDLTAAIDQLGVDAAADQVVDTLRTLREKAEQLLSVAPLPEAMRPVVEQLISTLEGIDFDVVFRPMRDAASQLEVPDEVRTTITDTLVQIREAIANLIPAELIASIEAEVNDALDVIRGFDPAGLLPDVTLFLNEAAEFVERLDPRQAVAGLNEPFQAVLDGIDAAHPRRLLAPVIEAYDSVFARVQLPGPELAMRRFSDLVNAAGDATAQAVTAPVRQLTAAAGAPPGTGPESAPPPRGPAAPGSGTPLPESFRPGDVVRLFGYLPARVREGLQTLEAGPAGDVLQRIDSLTAGLARDLRRLQHELRQIDVRLHASLDAALAPIGERQLNAQANIRARFSNDDIEVTAAVAAVAEAGPGGMRLALSERMDLLRTRVAGAVTSAGGNVAAALERTATALESARLARITGDLDDFLAALDPEPLATDLDDLVRLVLQRAPGLLAGVEAQLTAAVQRIAGIVHQLNPAIQAQKFVRILNVLKEELDILNPSVLADELGEIHAAIRRVVAAFDPAMIADDLFGIVQETANSIRALDPATLLGDLSFLDGILAEAEAAIPTEALRGVGESLAEVGNRLVELDPNGLLDAVENLGPRIIDEVEHALNKVRDEILALLESIRYANASASVGVSARVG